MTDPTQAGPTDPDVAHLLALLNLLPDPSDDTYRDAWANEFGKNAPDGPYYVLNKLCASIRNVLDQASNARAVVGLAQYVLMFFDGANPERWEWLGRRVTHFSGSLSVENGEAVIGERWARDTCDTAWRIYVRYRHADPVHGLREKWPADRSTMPAWWSQPVPE